MSRAEGVFWCFDTELKTSVKDPDPDRQICIILPAPDL